MAAACSTMVTSCLWRDMYDGASALSTCRPTGTQSQQTYSQLISVMMGNGCDHSRHRLCPKRVSDLMCTHDRA